MDKGAELLFLRRAGGGGAQVRFAAGEQDVARARGTIVK
jgi:hypothetical protein